jgi:hypothetical protein
MFNCFDIITNSVQKGVKVLLKGPVMLCANSKKDMKEWIDAILEFKECQIDINNVDNKKVLIDFTKVNELLKEKNDGCESTNGSSSIKKKIKKLSYENSDKAINVSSSRVSKEIWMKKAMESILQTIKRGNIKRNQVTRTYQNKLKEAKSFSEDIKIKQDLIEQIIAKRLEKEQERESQMVKLEQKTKEMELLRAVKKKIMIMKEEEIKTYKKQFITQIETEKKKANTQARKMMKVIVDQNRFTEFDDCTEPLLLFFKDQNYVNKVCKIYYGENVIFIYLTYS